MASSSVCRIPEYIKIVDEQNAIDVDGYINVQRRKGSPNFVMSVFQLRCSDARQYHEVYEELFNKFWSRGVYAAGKAAHGQGDPEDEIFLIPLQLDGKIRDPLRIFATDHHVGSRDFAMFLFVRSRVVIEPQASQQASGDRSWMAFNPWWWPLQAVQHGELDGSQRTTIDPEQDLIDYIGSICEEPWYVAPKDFDNSICVPTA